MKSSRSTQHYIINNTPTIMDNTTAGWLILLSDGSESTHYELHKGKNRIGRQSTLSRPDIPVANDIYVSRNHAVLAVKLTERNTYEYILADNEKVQGKPSTNGTYLNNSKERIDGNPVRLKDGDVIRCGKTSFKLKTTDLQVEAADGVKLAQKVEDPVFGSQSRNGGVLRFKM